MPRGTLEHSSTHSFGHSSLLSSNVPGTCSVLGTGLATGDSELNKIQSLPRRGSQVNEVEGRETHNYMAIHESYRGSLNTEAERCHPEQRGSSSELNNLLTVTTAYLAQWKFPQTLNGLNLPSDVLDSVSPSLSCYLCYLRPLFPARL